MRASMLLRWIDVARLRIRTLIFRARVEAELDRELEAHLANLTEEYIAQGLEPEDARLAAVRAFGGVAQVKEEVRETRGVSLVENIMRDLRYALRGLRREPMLIIASAGSIALGVGGNIAVYSLARELLLAVPDVRSPESLVRMEVSHGSHASYQRWLDLNESGALAAIAGFSIEKQVNWYNVDHAVAITPMVVTANFFDVTGVPLAFGRAFSAGEARAERDPRFLVLSHAFWEHELGADSAVLGHSLMLNGEAYTILGVLAPRLRSIVGFGIAPSAYVPLSRAVVPEMTVPNANVVALIGRLRPGQTISQGRAAVDAVDRRLGRLQGDSLYAGVQEFERVGTLTGKMSATVGAFFALAGLVSLAVLLIGCANVAGLLIARGTSRRREIAIRFALGGTRARLLQQFLVEGFWLALLGTAIGTAASVVFMRLVNGLTVPIPFPIELHLALNGPVFAAALGLVAVCMVLCALLPALTATRLTLVAGLRREEPQLVGKRLTLRGLLLLGQVTVSTVLLVTAFLFLRNLERSQVTDPGFAVDNALVVQLGFDESRPASEHVALLERAVERVAALPGVERAAYSRVLPLTASGGSSNGREARIDGRASSEHIEYALGQVGPGYFAAMGIRLLQGREFQREDALGSPSVGIVNAEFARRYFHGESPVGRRVQLGGDGSWRDIEIVGVVANGKHRTIGEDQRAAIYQPVRQYEGGLGASFVIAHVGGDVAGLATAVRDAVAALDRSVAVEVKPMRSALAFALLPSQVGAALLGTLGMLGLLLAMVGLYAIVSYTVSRRVGEIAIRSALGAGRRQVAGLVVRDATVLVGVGLAAGLAISALVTRPLAAFLVAGLSATDPLSLAATAAAFVVVTVVASWLPARRAMRVSPSLAMRLE
jgi:predicted permease